MRLLRRINKLNVKETVEVFKRHTPLTQDMLDIISSLEHRYSDDDWITKMAGTFSSVAGVRSTFAKFVNRRININEVDDIDGQFEAVRAYLNNGGKTTDGCYQELAWGKTTAEKLAAERSARMSGSNNIAAGHGGKNSVYSKNFTKYDGLTQAERKDKIASVLEKRSQTVINNPHNNPKRVEYFIDRFGVTPDVAQEMLSESQKTFSLDLCVEKYGITNGTEIWNNRQDQWQDTLKSKPIGERYAIARQKAGSVNSTMTDSERFDPRRVYIMYLTGGYTKVGYAENINNRIRQVGNESNEMVNHVEVFICDNEIAYELESVIVDELKKHSLFMNGQRINGVESTEYFIDSDEFRNDLASVLRNLDISFTPYQTT